MPSFQDSAVIFFLALLLFGPKKLPELARQLGKLMGEFRRASNEFRVQMEDELRASEQEERQKQIAAIEAAAPQPAPTIAAPAPGALAEIPSSTAAEPLDTSPTASSPSANALSTADPELASALPSEPFTLAPHPHEYLSAPAPAPAPIASAGGLNLMPPATGLPVARAANGAHATSPATSADLAPAFDAIPHSPAPEDHTPPPPDRRNHLAPPADPQHTFPPAETTVQHG